MSWVWPELKGGKAQAKRHKEFKERKESGYVTSEAQYRYWDHNLPMGRVPHLHAAGPGQRAGSRDLFEGTRLRADAQRARRATRFDISPDGRRIVFAFDPAAEKRIDNRFALAEIDLRTRPHRRHWCSDAGWDLRRAALQPRRRAHRLHRQPPGPQAHHAGAAGACGSATAALGRCVSAEWDHEVHAPLRWEDDGQALLFTAEQHGRSHLWRFDLPDRRAERRGARRLGAAPSTSAPARW